MERIACVVGNTYIYWSDITRGLAASAAVFTFLALYLKKEKKAAAVVFVLLTAMLSLVLSRLAHWYFRPDSYESLESAMNPLEPGGFALLGVFAGCFASALLLRLVRLTKDLPELLDCMCLALGLGIALGRLGSFFNTSDRGMVAEAEVGFPWVLPVTNPVSGIPEYRFATFLVQAMVTGLIVLILLVFYLAGKGKKGDTALLFLLCYGASQVVLDSTRYDSLYLRSNGFVSVVQVLSAVSMALVVIIYAVRLVRAGGWKRWHALMWLGQASCFGVAGFMEYYVQRHGNEAVFAYSVMSAALFGILILTLVSRRVAAVEEKKHAEWLRQLSAVEEEENP